MDDWARDDTAVESESNYFESTELQTARERAAGAQGFPVLTAQVDGKPLAAVWAASIIANPEEYGPGISISAPGRDVSLITLWGCLTAPACGLHFNTVMLHCSLRHGGGVTFYVQRFRAVSGSLGGTELVLMTTRPSPNA